MKENFRKIYRKSRKLGKQKYNSGIICPAKKNELNKSCAIQFIANLFTHINQINHF